ncbi:Cullin repeat-like-containing domain superfamily [Sesbania bispinosa]|nr:Cullin repeat-like-containing domain superfamily [Sesbania bispinosa]
MDLEAKQWDAIKYRPIYTLVKKSIVDEALSNLGVEMLNVSQVQKMEWEVLEPKIKCWLSSIKVAVGALFHGEKTLYRLRFAERPLRACLDSCELWQSARKLLMEFMEDWWNLGNDKRD